uniref:AMP-dependent synthetase/ligase domain-containing protein n=2 Tax=Meloidogyne TaxID=189290 RepID=A0A915NZ90_9BILA
MPLRVGGKEAIFCLDFAREKFDYIPFEATIPGILYRKRASDRDEFVFESENVSFTSEKIKNEVEKFAAGLLSAGLKTDDRILICGNNHSQLVISVLGAARAGIVFSIASPNFANADQLKHFLGTGQFNGFIYFGESDKANQLLLSICPEMQKGEKGKLKLKSFPKLTHVIFADEDHKHGGTYTLSDIFVKGNSEQIAKLPKYEQWDCHKICAIQFTSGSTGAPKAVALSHYQLINGSRIASSTIGIKRDTILCCALPLFRIPVFCLVVFSPFLFESRVVFPDPSPLPKLLFDSIKKHLCTNVLSNAAALRLLLRTQTLTQKQKNVPTLPSVDTVILLGERVSADLLIAIEGMLPNAKKIAVGMLSTELGSIPLLSDNTTNLVKSVGKVLKGYEVDVTKIDNLANNGHLIGELRLKPLSKTTFLGYGPDFVAGQEWISTGDVVSIQQDGNVDIITQHREDLIFDKIGRLVEHWRVERLVAQTSQQIRGIQIVQIAPGGPLTAVVIPKKENAVKIGLKVYTLLKQARSYEFDKKCDKIYDVSPNLFSGLQGANNYPDLVFAANAAVVRGNKAYLSNFFYPERKGEDYYYDKWFKENGYITKKDIHVPFEGAGDALWVGKNKLFCGIGPRTDVRALNLIAKNLKDDESPFKVYGFRLIDPRFYHIDTCLCPITEQLAIYYPYAFDPVARHNMSNELELVPVTEEEAIRFACNSIVIGKSVIIPVGAEQTAKALQKLGFDPKFVDMSEFIKSGGAAKCCTLQLSQ